MKPTFSLRDADYRQDFELLRAVREPVFVIEQLCPLDEEWDALDPLSRHVIAIDDQGQPIGTGRLTPNQRIGRMAVLAAARGIGVGAAVLKRLIEIAEDLGYPKITLSAQVHAIGFYQLYGFQAEGPEYDDAGIPHRLMWRALAASCAPTGPILFQRSHEARAAALAIVRSARHQLWLASPDLEPAIYDQEDFVAAVKQLALSGRGAAIHILVGDIRNAVLQGHRLVDLAQRLPSLIEIRRVVPEASGHFESALLLNDVGSWMRRPDPLSFDGEGHYQDAPRQRQCLQDFSHAWDRAEAETRLRVLKV